MLDLKYSTGLVLILILDLGRVKLLNFILKITFIIVSLKTIDLLVIRCFGY